MSTAVIAEPIAQLQHQLDDYRSTQPRRRKLPESLWQAAVDLAWEHGVYSVAHPLRLDYMGLKKRLGGVSRLRRKASKPAFVELIAACSDAARVRHRVPVLARRQGAHPVESGRTARLDKPTARLAGGGKKVIQITAQMRVLVAIEPVDGRKGMDSLTALPVFPSCLRRWRFCWRTASPRGEDSSWK